MFLNPAFRVLVDKNTQVLAAELLEMATEAIRVDVVSSTLIYVGKAAPGSITSAATWKVAKIVIATDGDTVITYADGDATYNNIWDNRLSLSYS